MAVAILVSQIPYLNMTSLRRLLITTFQHVAQGLNTIASHIPCFPLELLLPALPSFGTTNVHGRTHLTVRSIFDSPFPLFPLPGLNHPPAPHHPGYRTRTYNAVANLTNGLGSLALQVASVMWAQQMIFGRCCQPLFKGADFQPSCAAVVSFTDHFVGGGAWLVCCLLPLSVASFPIIRSHVEGEMKECFLIFSALTTRGVWQRYRVLASDLAFSPPPFQSFSLAPGGTVMVAHVNDPNLVVLCIFHLSTHLLNGARVECVLIFWRLRPFSPRWDWVSTLTLPQWELCRCTGAIAIAVAEGRFHTLEVVEADA
jgi:hypothetical protein